MKNKQEFDQVFVQDLPVFPPQISRKYLTNRKLERTRTRIKKKKNAFCLPFIGFFTQTSQYKVWNADAYSVLTNGNGTWIPGVGVSNCNPGQDIWNKKGKSSKTVQGKKSLISNFACFLIWALGCLHANLRFS